MEKYQSRLKVWKHRLLQRSSALALAALLVGGATVCAAPRKPMNQSSQQAKVEPMAAASAPVELTSGPTTVALPPVAAEQGKTLASRLSTLAAGDRIYLVLRDLAAQEQPGVTYQVYVDLPAGSVPDKDDPHYVGFISFYGARPDGSPLFRSFDVTDVLLKLKKQNLLSDQTTITIIPSPSGIRNASAKPVIGKIELVAQSNPPV